MEVSYDFLIQFCVGCTVLAVEGSLEKDGQRSALWGDVSQKRHSLPGTKPSQVLRNGDECLIGKVTSVMVTVWWGRTGDEVPIPQELL